MRRLIAFVFLFAGLCGACPPFAEPAAYELDGDHSVLSFHAKTPLHPFTGVTHALQGRLDADEKLVLSQPAEILIPVATLDTGNKNRDKEMRRMFEADRYPGILFTARKIVETAPGRYRIEGSLRIRDIEQEITMDVEAREYPGFVEVSGSVPLTTTMFKLKPPSVLGLIRVNENVSVTFQTRWNLQQ